MSNTGAQSALPTIASSPIALDDCGLTAVASLLGDRWTLLVLRSVFYGVRRFADIKADTGAPGSSLSTRLKRLVASGLLEERPYQDGAARTRNEYHLTPRAESLQMVLMVLMQWGDQHLREAPSQLEVVSLKTGEFLRLAWVDDQGREVLPDDTTYRLSN